MNRTGEGSIAKRQGRWVITAGYGDKRLDHKKLIFNAASSFN